MYNDSGLKCIMKALNRKELITSTVKSLLGMRFARLTVVERAGSTSYGKALWRCVCECGKEVVAATGSLMSGNTSSCGCYFLDRITKHGGSNKGSYNSWRAMMRRCNNPKDKDYKNYGERGITVCQEWRDYRRFAADMGEPTGSQTLDRIDVNGNYEPSNCKWSTPLEQLRNIRPKKSNKTGFKGVVPIKQKFRTKWMASISVNRRKFYSKVYNGLEEAVS